VPEATSVKVAICPTVTARFEGCVVIAGAEFTVRVAAALVVLPTALLTFTLN
jgi:uncharacterized membrane protein